MRNRIKIIHRGSFNRTEKFMNFLTLRGYLNKLDTFGQIGVSALASATPVDSGLTAKSWTYEIVRDEENTSISWMNTNIQNGISVVVLLRYGHATGTGGYVEGQDFITPAIQPIFDQIADGVWKEVKGA